MFVAFLVYLSHAVYFSREYRICSWIDPVYNFSSLAVYPMYYLYVRLLTVDTRFPWRYTWILIPALISGLLSAFFLYLMTPEEETAYLHHYVFGDSWAAAETSLIQWQSLNLKASRICFGIQLIPLGWYTSRLINTHQKHITDFYSDEEGKSLKWVRQIFFSFIILSVISIIINLIGRPYFIHHPQMIILPSLLFSSFLFLIGWLGIRQNYTVTHFCEETGFCTEPEPEIQSFTLSDTLPGLKKKLMELMEQEQVFKRPDLRITDLSGMLNTNRTYLSILINREMGVSFSDYINKYRVDYSKSILLDSKYSNYGMNFVSEQSGFASLNSFLRAFKKQEGITPAKFRQQSCGNCSEHCPASTTPPRGIRPTPNFLK
jgi:AraC-like DNA-binding protein